MQRGLDATATLWPELREAAAWSCQAAQILANAEQLCGAEVQERYEAWLATLRSQQSREGWLGQVATTFLKVSANYLEGLFHCYAVPDLPATNNELERCFGTLRYHARRTSGRRAVSGTLVLRGAVRVVAILSTGRAEEAAAQLRLKDREAWQQLRQQLATRAESRRAQRRFRQDPAGYLTKLEQQLLK